MNHWLEIFLCSFVGCLCIGIGAGFLLIGFKFISAVW